MKKELLTRFMEKRIVELKKEQRNGTAHVYQSTLNRLKNFMNGREITFSQLTPEWLALFEQKLLADQLKWNTISTYMRMLRSVYNQALERGVATYVPRLFNKVHTGIDCPVKRAVSPEVICRLMTDRKPLPGKLAFSRDGYTFVFHAATLPAGAWTKVRIEGDHKGTTLYINGEKAERLEGRVKQFYNYTHKRKDKMYMQETLVFPMRQIGDVQNGFRGKLRNINCTQ